MENSKLVSITTKSGDIENTYEGRCLIGIMIGTQAGDKGETHSDCLLIGKASPEEALSGLAAEAAQIIKALAKHDQKLEDILFRYFSLALGKMMDDGCAVTEEIDYLKGAKNE